ncbi:hypothetical protein Bca4012_086947 [Brassica carinata]
MNTKNLHILEEYASVYQLHDPNLCLKTIGMYEFRAIEWFLKHSFSSVVGSLGYQVEGQQLQVLLFMPDHTVCALLCLHTLTPVRYKR